MPNKQFYYNCNGFFQDKTIMENLESLTSTSTAATRLDAKYYSHAHDLLRYIYFMKLNNSDDSGGNYQSERGNTAMAGNK